MPSEKPQDLGAVVVPLALAGPIQKISINLGTFTANQTKTTLAHCFDRRGVIREIWFGADAVPADADGTMLVHADVRDKSEGAFDTVVNGFDAEAQLTVAFEAKKAVLITETAENELTVEPGDTLRFRQVSNSAAIDTNAAVVATVLFQPLAVVE